MLATIASSFLLFAFGAAAHYANSTTPIIGPFGPVSPYLAASVVSANPCTTVFDLSCYKQCSTIDPNYTIHVTQYPNSWTRHDTSQLHYTPSSSATDCENTTTPTTTAQFLTVSEGCTFHGPLSHPTQRICTNTYIMDAYTVIETSTYGATYMFSQAEIPVTAGAALPTPSGENCLASASATTLPYATTSCSESAYASKWSA